MAMAISDPTSLYNLLNGVQDPVPATNAGKELAYVRTIAGQTQTYTQVIKDAAASVTSQGAYPANNDLADQLKIVARLIGGGLKTRVYLVNIGGFDTHSGQVVSGATETGDHATLLAKLSSAIKAFQDDLQGLGVADRVTGMTFSEFGRRIVSNYSEGTDHGAAAPLFVFGNKVIPGILGNNPTISAATTVNDNLPMQYDFRSVYASLLQDWFCVPKSVIDSSMLLQNFQSLPLVDPSGCTSTAIHEINAKAGINLIRNYPNPFVEKTKIEFTTGGGQTLVQVFDGEGKLIKVHGGALSLAFNDITYPSKKIYSQDNKKIIAQKAAALIKDGMFVLTGGGTTIVEMARSLPPALSATFISGSIPAVVEYMHHPNIEVIVIGDKLSKNSRITLGADAISRIKSVKPDLCFLGINAIDIIHGITDNDWDVVQLKQAMISSSQKKVCLTISEKLNTFQPIQVCRLLDIDILVTELPPDNPLLQPYVQAGIMVI